MIVLAFEFSTICRGVAVVRDGEVLSEVRQMDGRHTRIIGLMQAALDEAKTHRAEISHLALGIGPGSYMGIRLSIAAVQGWLLARETTVIPVSSFSVLARMTRSNLGDEMVT